MFPPDEILWLLNTHVSHKLPSGSFAPHPRVNISHTVVLRQGILAAWFFTSVKDGSERLACPSRVPPTRRSAPQVTTAFRRQKEKATQLVGVKCY